MRKILKKAVLFAGIAAAFWFLAIPNAIKADNELPRPLFLKITAYASTPDETDSTPFITASGLRVRDGIVASNVLPFGTRIQIPALFGNKVFTVEDRMAARIKNTVDIWMPTREAALRFGVNWTDVLILPTPISPRALTLL